MGFGQDLYGKYEYKVLNIRFDGSKAQEELNSLGAQGWMLYHVQSTTNPFTPWICIFIRTEKQLPQIGKEGGGWSLTGTN